MVQVEKVIRSPNKTKRFQVIMTDGSKYNFGAVNGSTYIDHGRKDLRENYRKRHLGNKTEEYRISNIIPSPALFSYYLLWGLHTSLDANIKHLNRLLI